MSCYGISGVPGKSPYGARARKLKWNAAPFREGAYSTKRNDRSPGFLIRHLHLKRGKIAGKLKQINLSIINIYRPYSLEE